MSTCQRRLRNYIRQCSRQCPHSPIYSSEDEAREQMKKAKKLHELGKYRDSKRQQQKALDKQMKSLRLSFNSIEPSMELIICIEDAVEDDFIETKENDLNFFFEDTKYPTNILKPSCLVKQRNGIFTARIMFNKPLNNLMNWKTNATPLYHTLKSNEPLFAINFTEDMNILR
eukprot:537938_1